LATLRLFASAREAAGTARDDIPGATVGDVLDAARARYGDRFAEVLAGSRVWLNGEPAADHDPVREGDEVAVLPPVSGGAVEEQPARPGATRSDADPGPDGPHVRLGLLWALATTAAAAGGPVVLALWLAPVSGMAAAQAARTWRRQSERADIAVAGGAAAMIVLAAAAGPLGVAAGVAAAAAAAFLRAVPPVVPLRTLTPALAMGLAGAAPVALRSRGFGHAFVLLALVWAYDAGDYVVGTGAQNRWEGPAAGVAAVAAVTLAAAVVFVPPFEGVLPWVFGAIAAAAAPFGQRLGSMVLGDRDARVPVVRRLDSLLAAGPPFAVLGLVLLG
jgi:molybdopterin converting factor small subunit/CDP-diglyceride synthetase